MAAELAEKIYIADITLSADPAFVQGLPIEIGKRAVVGISMQTLWNLDGEGAEDLVATLLWEASNDPRARPGDPDEASARWTNISAKINASGTGDAVEPSSGVGSDLVIINNTRLAWLRMRIVRVSGEGRVAAYLEGHD